MRSARSLCRLMTLPVVLSFQMKLFPAILSNKLSLAASTFVTRSPLGDCKMSTEVTSPVLGLKPDIVWRNFQRLANIPRPSKAEHEVS